MRFEALVHKTNMAKRVKPFVGRLLAFDPGQTTGYSFWLADDKGPAISKCGQLDTWPIENAVKAFTHILDVHDPSQVVFEAYRVYSWKTEEHTWSDVPTLHVIGCLETLCIQRGIPFCTQSAQQAKNFVTDDKLKNWNFWERGQKHARDAIRHGFYYLMFGKAGL